MSERQEIESLREEVKDATGQIIQLASKRYSLIRKIGELKAKIGLDVDDRRAELRLRRHVIDTCDSSGLPREFGLKIMNLLVEESIEVQRRGIRQQKTSPISIFDQAKRLEDTGAKVIHMEVGEPDFGPPREVVEATCSALRTGRTHYTSAGGIPQLREAIAHMVSEKTGADISPDQVLATVGAKSVVYLALAVKVKPGDSALIIEPAWPSYAHMVRMLGGRPVNLPTTFESKWSPNLDDVESLVDESTRVVVLNYPNNPTGRILDRGVFEQLVEVAARRHVTVVSDEVYSDFSFKEFRSVASHTECSSITVGSFSKSWGMTGFRIGYVVSDSETALKMSRLASQIYTSVAEFTQYGALAALNCSDKVKEYRDIVLKRVDVASKALRRLPVRFHEPDGGLYIFFRPDRDGFNSEEFAYRLLVHKGVALTPGSAFGPYPAFLRMALCHPEEVLLEGISKVGEMLR